MQRLHVRVRAGQKYEVDTQHPNWVRQASVLTHRTFLNNLRNVGLFWMRLAMYVMLCLCIAFVYFQASGAGLWDPEGLSQQGAQAGAGAMQGLRLCLISCQAYHTYAPGLVHSCLLRS